VETLEAVSQLTSSKINPFSQSEQGTVNARLRRTASRLDGLPNECFLGEGGTALAPDFLLSLVNASKTLHKHFSFKRPDSHVLVFKPYFSNVPSMTLHCTQLAWRQHTFNLLLKRSGVKVNYIQGYSK